MAVSARQVGIILSSGLIIIVKWKSKSLLRISVVRFIESPLLHTDNCLHVGKH